MTKTKIALAAALFAATSSAAFAQFDPNLSNRYPGYAEPNTYGYVGGKLQSMNAAPAGTLQSAPVRLQQHRNVRLHSAPVLQQRDVALPSADTSATAGPFWYNGSGPTSGGM